MKLLATSDLHQMNSKWKQLVKACKRERPEVVAIAGDLFPKDTYITGQLPFMKHLVKYVKQIKDTGAEVVMILGNDDNQNIIPEFEKCHEDGLFHYVSERVVEINGYEFAGMPFVPDYPFGYKFWCRGEYADSQRIDPTQFTEPVVVNENNEFEFIPDYQKYLKDKKSIFKSLIDIASCVKDINKSIWLIHAPPCGMGLDICAHGANVGSGAILDFIEKYQPMLCIHGHIHEAPEHNGHKWNQYCNETLCVQGGQVGLDLHYSTIDIKNGKIKGVEHSIYG